MWRLPSPSNKPAIIFKEKNWTHEKLNYLITETASFLQKECELKIGGQTIDKHTSKWLDIQNELYDKDEQEWIGINKHPGKFGYFKKGNKDIDPHELKMYIPFHFWFCDNPGLYLPIIGITKHEVELHILTRSVEYLFNLPESLKRVASTKLYRLYIG